METTPKGTERNNEIVTFFYLIFGHRIHQGMDQDMARKEAYDAVSLRYGIGKGRLHNIISEQNNSRRVNRTAFRENVITLIENITAVNEEIDAVRSRNETLIQLLKDCLEHDGR
jgi:hypothetical protein